jgi:hypothetical protein
MVDKDKKQDISINLNCYIIRFRKKNDIDNFLTINEVFGKKKFTDIVQEFVKTINTKAFVNLTQDRILYLDKILTLTSSIYSGIVRKGYSGQETYVDELKANKANTVGKIQTDQFNSTPFYFNLALPTVNSNYFLFIAQSYKQYGFKELFEEAFKKFFKDNYSNDILCEVGTLSIASLFEKYVKDGNIRKLRFKKHMLTQNLENLLGEKDDKDKTHYEMELSILAKKQGFLGIKKNISFEDSSFIETFQIDGFEYDEAFADVSFGGRKRVLNITNPRNFSASYDVTEKAAIDKNTKHPNFEKLDKEAIGIVKDEIIPNIK